MPGRRGLLKTNTQKMQTRSHPDDQFRAVSTASCRGLAACSACPASATPEGFAQILDSEWFGQVVVHSCRQELLAVSTHGIGGQGDDGDIGVKLREVNPEQSIHFMNQALETKGGDMTREDLWMVNEMGVSLRKKGDWKGAVETYQQALNVIPNEAGLHYNMGMAYAQGKEHYKAVCEFDKAIAASADILQESPLIPFNIGMVYFQMNRLQEVERYMKVALKLDPGFAWAKAMIEKIGSKAD